MKGWSGCILGEGITNPKALNPANVDWPAWFFHIDKNMETTIIGYIGTTIRIHSFIPS